MNTIETIIQQANDLLNYIYEEVETILLPPEETKDLDWDNDPDAEEKMRYRMTEEEREWYDLVEDFCQNLYFFKAKLEE